MMRVTEANDSFDISDEDIVIYPSEGKFHVKSVDEGLEFSFIERETNSDFKDMMIRFVFKFEGISTL